MSHPFPQALRVHGALAEVPKEAWNALLPEGAAPFLRWEWLNALEQSGSVTEERGWQPSHLTLWEGTRLLAAAPAYLKAHSNGEFVFDWTWASAAERAGIAYYPKLVVAVPLTPATGARLLTAPGEDREALVRRLLQGLVEVARAQDLSSVHVLFPTEPEALLMEEAGFALRTGVQYQWRNRGYRTFDDFLASFRSRRRNQIRRELRAPGQQGVELRTRRGAELSEDDTDLVWRLYTSTVDKYVYGHRYLTRDFFRRVLADLPDAVELVDARRDGEWVAGTFNVAGKDALYGRYWGCVEDLPFLHFNVCLYHPVEQAIARGLARFEPGAGGEHKLVRGFEPALTWSAHQVFDSRLDRAVRSFLSHEREAIRQGLPRWAEETGFRRDGRQGSD